MVSVKSLSLLVLAGTALAAPSDWTLHKRCGDIIHTNGWSFPNCWGACCSDPACSSEPACSGNKPASPAPAPAPASPPPPPPQQQEQQQPQNKAQSSGGSGDSGDQYTGTVNKYRDLLQKGHLDFDSHLLDNIKLTLQHANGQLRHELNPGTNGQVLAQGDCGDFETTLVHGWICERPSLLPSGSCSNSKINYNLMGQTGHADILDNDKFKKVACACDKGVWGCDFAF